MNDIELDALRELGNSGCENAAISLSNMINKKIYLIHPEVVDIPVENLINNAKLKDGLSVGMSFEINGDLRGSMLLVFEKASAKKLAALLMKIEDSSTVKLDGAALSSLNETGNIIVGNYLNSLVNFLDLQLLPSIPHTSVVSAPAMVNNVATLHTPPYKTALVNSTDIFVEDNIVSADLILMFNEESNRKVVEKIHKTLGV